MGVPPDGSIDQYKTAKTRRVAKAFYQRYGIDYSKMFSLVIEPTFVALKWFDILQLDINNAFFNRNLTKSS